MVWTAAEFKTETNLGKLSSRGTELCNIDRALAAYHDLPGDAADNQLLYRLVLLQAAIEAWLEAKRYKRKSRRRDSILTLMNQVLPELDRLENAIAAAQVLAVVQALPPPPPPPQLPELLRDDETGRYYYRDVTNDEVRWTASEDWEVLTDTTSGRRYYNNTVAQRTFWVEPNHWDVLSEEDGTHRTYYFDRVRWASQWERPPELTDERIHQRDITHLVRATRWVPDDYYTIEEGLARGPTAATMTPYRSSLTAINKNKDNLDPKIRRILRGDVLHLEIREDVQTARLTTGPYSERSKAPINLAQVNAWEGARVLHGDNLRVAQDVARQAVLLARRLLPRGAFNNRGGVIPPPTTWSADPGRDMQRMEQIAERLLGDSGDFLHAIACNAAATRAIGGGVCSMIGALTAGLLTVISPPGTEIICGSHSADHTYCVIRYNNCPWVCADAWPQYSYPCRWQGSYFAPTSDGPLNYYFKIDVHQPVRVPFGLASTPSESLEPNAVAVIAGECPGSPGEIGHPYGHTSNTAANDHPARFDGVAAVVGPRDWGAAADVSTVFPWLT